MAISERKPNCYELEEEYEDFEEMLIEEVEDDDYEEAFEEEEEIVELKEEDEDEYEEQFEEEEEIEQNKEEVEDGKKLIQVGKVEEEESVKESGMEEDEEEIEPSEEEEEEEIEQNEEEVEDGKKLIEVGKVEEEEESVKESGMEEDEEEEMEPSEEEEDIEPIEEEEVEEIEHNEEEVEDGKKLIEVGKIEEEEESTMEKDETVNRKQTAELDVEQNEDEEEEDIEPSEEEMEEMEQNEEVLDDGKKVFESEKIEEEEEEESVQESARDEDKIINLKKPSESEGVLFPPAGFLSLLQSVSNLEKLHGALSKFLYEWNSFNRSLGSITSAIDEHESSLNDKRSEQKKDERTDHEKKKEKRSYVEFLHEGMSGKSLRKQIEHNIHNIHRIRHEMPEALRRLQNPEKLVFEAVGKFYTQGRKAFDNNGQLVLHRRASILLLEFFILSGRPTEESSVRVEANNGAILWWKRLVNENFETASVEDCLGLVLFLACFGISMVFASRDLCALLMKSDLRKKINLLRKSSILVKRIPGIIKDLIRGEMYYEAAELSCSFELMDNFPPLPLLSSLVERVIQAAKTKRESSQTFPNIARQADSWELTSLRSVVKFLEYYKFDPNSLDSVHLHERISELESYIDGDAAVLLNNIRKRKVQNQPTARSRSRARFKNSFPSTPKTSQNPPQMIQNNPEKELPSHPLLPENYALSAAVCERAYFRPPASYRPSAVESKTPEKSPSYMIPKKREMELPSYPLFSDQEGWGRRAYLEFPARYGPSVMECSSAQQFYNRHALGYENVGGGLPVRDLYKFADTVEAQLSKSRRTSNSSPGGAKFGYY